MADIEERAYTDEKIDYTNYLKRKAEHKRTREETVSILKRMADSYEEDAEKWEHDAFQSAVFKASADAYRRAARMIEYEME